MSIADDPVEPSPGRKSRRRLRWLLRAITTPFVLVFALISAAPYLVAALALVYLGAAALASLPALYAMASFAAVAAAIALGAVCRLLWPREASGDVGLPMRSTSVGDRAARLTSRTATVAVVGGIAYVFMDIFKAGAENHPAGVFAMLALAGAAGYATMIAIEKAAGRERSLYPWDHDTVAIVPGIVILAFAVTGAIAGWNVRQQGELHDYCSYGAVSDAQMTGCLDHVTTDQIDRLDTNAARFARGPLDSCLYDAGPFCARALYDRNNAPSDPNR